MENSQDMQQSSRFLSELSSLPAIAWALERIVGSYERVKASSCPLVRVVLLVESIVCYLRVASQPVLNLLQKPISVTDDYALRLLEFVKSVDPIVTLPLNEAGERFQSWRKNLYDFTFTLPSRVYQMVQASVMSVRGFPVRVWSFLMRPEEWRQVKPVEVGYEWVLYVLTKLGFFYVLNAVIEFVDAVKQRVKCCWSSLKDLLGLSSEGTLYGYGLQRYSQLLSSVRAMLQSTESALSMESDQPRDQSEAEESNLVHYSRAVLQNLRRRFLSRTLTEDPQNGDLAASTQ